MGHQVQVGDDAQAIYGFRAATVDHMRAFTDHYPGAQTITLAENYRSVQPILDVAKAWQKMGAANKGAPPQWLSTHPSGPTRIKEIEKHLPEVLPLYEKARRAR